MSKDSPFSNLSNGDSADLTSRPYHPSQARRSNIRITPTNVPSPEEGVYQESAQDIHLRWITLIEEYTGYKLTVSTDKLAAISGLASLMRIPSVTIFVVSEKTSFGSTCSGEHLTYCQILSTNSHESILPSHGHGLLFLVELSIYIDPSLKNAAEIVGWPR
jgi:hypothetical protein